MLFWEDNEPDFTNELGVKWWHDEDLTNYAKRKQLADLKVWVIQFPDGHRTRVIVKKDKVIYDNQSLEAVADQIDIIAFLRKQK